MHFEGFGPWPQYSDAEQRAVVQVLATGRVNYWTGELCRRFEAEFARFADCTHAAALANGTVALDVALRALGIGPGDEVIVTPRSFVASVSAVANAGATPIFADVDLDSGNISAATIAPCITAKTKAVVPVHLGGWPCDMPSIIDLTRSHGLAVIEDCAQAHGAAIDGRSVGSFGEVGAWSFCQDKIMTTGGEGGMVTTNDPELWRLMWEYKDHGKNLDKVRQPHTSAGFRWLHDSFGTNWRMIEMQAAIGLLQLEVMSRWRERRAELASRYAALMADFSGLVRVPSPPAHVTHAYYRFYAYIRPAGLREGWSRDRIIAEANSAGVPLMQGSCSEIYLEESVQRAGLAPTQRLPNARILGSTSICCLTHPTITDAQIEGALHILHAILERAAR